MLRILLLSLCLLATPLLQAETIAGVWKFVGEPGWIEINLDEAKGIVVRNDKFPERVGRVLLRGLSAHRSKPGLWRGQIYAEQLGDYTDAQIVLVNASRMEIEVKMGFMSRTFEWQRDKNFAPISAK